MASVAAAGRRNTALLTLQNGLDNERALATLFPNQPVFGGMCFVCINRTQPGVIHHIAHGKIVLGRHGGSPDVLTESIAKLIRSSGIPVDVSPDLERTHWEKLIWNIPFNGLGVAGAAGLDATLPGHCPGPKPIGPCLTTALLDEGLGTLVTELMDEVIASGWRLNTTCRLAWRLSESHPVMGAYRASTLIDFDAVCHWNSMPSSACHLAGRRLPVSKPHAWSALRSACAVDIDEKTRDRTPLESQFAHQMRQFSTLFFAIAAFTAPALGQQIHGLILFSSSPMTWPGTTQLHRQSRVRTPNLDRWPKVACASPTPT
ncbi:MAG: hypothetical protein CM1200mP29_02720 [Verrucomicrobiota bacterium]|nr:MAG: hypothetical protein CM1200mP29_02720 [Verrucomicrobiota bacterium]